MKCINCDNEIAIDLAKALDEEGEVYRCPHCGFIFRYTDKEHSSKPMYVKIDKNYKVNLMEMTFEEAVALMRMIQGASLEERRTFNRVLQQLEKPIDELMK